MLNKVVFPSGCFPDFIAGLLKAIGCHNNVVTEWLRLYMHTRVRRIEARINKLLEKLRAGIYRAPTPRTRNPDAPLPDAPRKERPKPDPRAWVPRNIATIIPADARMPRGFAWMNRLLRDPANPTTHIYTGPGAAGHLDTILQQDVEIQEFAKACPALARQLRALGHMLGVKLPDYLKLPKRPRKPRPPRPKREKPKKFKIYKYWMRSAPLGAARLLRLRKKTSKW